MIKFTIVTVTYNAEGVLRPTTDSVLMQSYAHVERRTKGERKERRDSRLF